MEKSYEKYVWVLLFVVGVVISIIGFRELVLGQFADPQVGENLTGRPWEELEADPFVIFLTRGLGIALITVGGFTMAITWFSYRVGEKWAWYTSWVVVLFLLVAGGLDINAEGSVWPLQIGMILIALVGLLLPFQKFFPKD